MLRMVSETESPFTLQGMYDLRSLCAAAVAYNDGDDEDDPDDDPDAGDGDEGADGKDDKGSSGTDGDGKKPEGKKSIKDPEGHRLSREAAGYRRQLREAQTKLKEYEDKDKSELEIAQRDAKELKELSETQAKEISQLKQMNLLLMSPAARQFKDVADALRLVDLSKLEADDDGNYDSKAADEALNALAKKYPAMTESTSSDGDDNGSNGTPSGRPANGKGSDKKKADQAALEKKFPVLAGRS